MFFDCPEKCKKTECEVSVVMMRLSSCSAVDEFCATARILSFFQQTNKAAIIGSAKIA